MEFKTIYDKYEYELDYEAFVMPYKDAGKLDVENYKDKFLKLTTYTKGNHIRCCGITYGGLRHRR